MMKTRLVSVIFSAALALGLVGCGGGGSSSGNKSSSSSVSSATSSSVASSDNSSSSSNSSLGNTAMLDGFNILYPEHLFGEPYGLGAGVVPEENREDFSTYIGMNLRRVQNQGRMELVHQASPASDNDIVLLPTRGDAAVMAYSNNRILMQAFHYDETLRCFARSSGDQINASMNVKNEDGTIGTYMKITYPWESPLGEMTLAAYTSTGKIKVELNKVGTNLEFKSLSVGGSTVYNLVEYANDNVAKLGFQTTISTKHEYADVVHNLCAAK